MILWVLQMRWHRISPSFRGAEKKAKRLAKEGPKEEEVKPKTLDISKPITLDFLTNPDKE